MADRTDSPTCPICFEAYTATAHPHDRRPIIVCKNGHTLCSTCANGLDTCPTCREPKMVIPNRALLDVIDRLRQNLTLNDTGVPEISADHVKLAARPFADGAYADVYDATWQKQSVVLKVLRRHVVAACELQDLLEEARLAMSLDHPNVVRVFGVVSIDGGIGLLMEKADRGSLRSALKNTDNLSLSPSQQVSLSIEIVNGIDFIHSKQMVHRNLKPENVLLFDIESQLTAKIADFGTSKVVQTSLARTAMVDTPYFMAPELFKPQVRYGPEVDVYSVAIVLYEVFSGRNIRDAYAGIENAMQLAMCVASGQRPEMPESFPAELRTVVDRGWSADANVRPTLADFREALSRLQPSTRNAPTASGSGSGDADAYAAFEAQLHKLELSTQAYKLVDARSQVEACRRLWMHLDASDRTTATVSVATARFHSVKGYVHHWFGECSDAYKETYQALTKLYELSLSGTSAEGEQVITILRRAVEVCWSQDQEAAAIVLVSYAVQYAKSKLSDTANADALECLCCVYHGRKLVFVPTINLSKILEFVLSTRLKASTNKPHISVAIAHYCLAQENRKDSSTALQHLEEAQHVINQVDADNIWAAVCKSYKGYVNYQFTSDKRKYEKAKPCLEDALGIAERTLGENNPTVSEIYFRLAFTLRKMTRLEESECAYKKAIGAAENSLGPNSWLAAWTMEWLANMCKDEVRKYKEAEELFLRSAEIYKSVYGPANSELSRLYFHLALTYKRLGQAEKAATNYRLASEVDDGIVENRLKNIYSALEKLVDEVSSTLESGSEVSEAPGELADVLHNFFTVAPQPQPL